MAVCKAILLCILMTFQTCIYVIPGYRIWTRIIDIESKQELEGIKGSTGKKLVVSGGLINFEIPLNKYARKIRPSFRF